MKTYEPLAGTDIRAACSQAITLAQQTGEDVQFEFNNILLTARPDSSALEMVEQYWTETEARAKAYRESPEGIAAAERARQIKDEGERANETGGVLNPALLTLGK